MELVSRKDAQSKGLTHYFTGRPCAKGHIAKRYVKGTRCFSCNVVRGLNHRTKNWVFSTPRDMLQTERERRNAADDAGEVRYISIVACKKGHIGERYTKGRACVQCLIDKSREKYAADPVGQVSERKARRLANLEKERGRDREYNLANKVERSEKHVALRKRRRATDPVFAMKHRIRSLIRASLLVKGYGKRTKTAAILGCTWEEFRIHIERQFLPGMNWGNRTEWQIDHITPMATATSEEMAIALNHFTNLRPIWGADNLQKSDKILYLI